MIPVDLMPVLVAIAAIAAVGLIAVLVLLGVLLARRPADARETREAFETLARSQAQAAEQTLRELRGEVLEQARANRTEMADSIGRFGHQLTEQIGTVAALQNARIEGFAQQLAGLNAANDRRLTEIREVLEARLRELQTDNTAKLEQMRQTVDEKLHATLEQRLGESFRLVSDKLEQVHRGLGEMQALAGDVGDL
jgi:DNA recombination protein RmuC